MDWLFFMVGAVVLVLWGVARELRCRRRHHHPQPPPPVPVSHDPVQFTIGPVERQ